MLSLKKASGLQYLEGKKWAGEERKREDMVTFLRSSDEGSVNPYAAVKRTGQTDGHLCIISCSASVPLTGERANGAVTHAFVSGEGEMTSSPAFVLCL